MLSSTKKQQKQAFSRFSPPFRRRLWRKIAWAKKELCIFTARQIFRGAKSAFRSTVADKPKKQAASVFFAGFTARILPWRKPCLRTKAAAFLLRFDA